MVSEARHRGRNARKLRPGAISNSARMIASSAEGLSSVRLPAPGQMSRAALPTAGRRERRLRTTLSRRWLN